MLAVEEYSHRTNAGGHIHNGHITATYNNRIARSTVNPRCRSRRKKRLAAEIRPPRSDNARKQIPHPAKRHKWIARRILVHLPAIRRNNKRTRALQNNGSAITPCNLLRGGTPVARNIGSGNAKEPRRLAFVRSQDDRRSSITAPRLAYRGEMRQRVCIDYEPPFLGKNLAHESRRFLAKPKPGPDYRHIGKRNIATKVRHRRLWEQSPCGKARLRREDETDKPRASGTCAEPSNHRCMRKAVRTADDRNGADGTLVRVARPRTKASYYLLGHFHVRVIIAKTRPRQKCHAPSA